MRRRRRRKTRRRIEGGQRRKATRFIKLKKLWTTPNNVSTSSFVFSPDLVAHSVRTDGRDLPSRDAD